MSRTKPASTVFSNFRLDFTPLRTRRRQLDLTQKQLGAAAGVHWMTVHRTERGRTAPSIAQMVAISRALGVPTHLLYTVTSLEGPDA